MFIRGETEIMSDTHAELFNNILYPNLIIGCTINTFPQCIFSKVAVFEICYLKVNLADKIS